MGYIQLTVITHLHVYTYSRVEKRLQIFYSRSQQKLDKIFLRTSFQSCSIDKQT